MFSLSIKHYYFDNYRSLQKKNEQYQMKSYKNVPQKDKIRIEQLYYDIQNKTEKYFNSCGSTKYIINFEECNILWEEIDALAINLYDLYNEYDVHE
tara:strand:+ start:1835 stop:2122 length:288 start_codon:yes stop_codon:yes gene_type:complete